MSAGATVTGQPGGPLAAVLRALDEGAPTLADVATRTGLPVGLVRLAVDRLVAEGVLEAGPIGSACGSDCGGCPIVRGGTRCPPVAVTRRAVSVGRDTSGPSGGRRRTP